MDADRKLPKEPDCHCSIPPRFYNQIIPNSFSLWVVCVFPKCCFPGFLSVCNGTTAGALSFSRQIREFFASEAEAAFKETALAPCKSIGQIVEGAHMRVAQQEVAETRS